MSLAASLVSALASLLGIVAAAIRRPSRRRQLELDVHAARAATAAGDADEANRLAERNRVRRMLPLALAAACGATLLTGCGCQSVRGWFAGEDHAAGPRTVVVAADRWMYPMTNGSGVAGWFVPDAVHAEMMEALVIVESIRARKGN